MLWCVWQGRPGVMYGEARVWCWPGRVWEPAVSTLEAGREGGGQGSGSGGREGGRKKGKEGRTEKEREAGKVGIVGWKKERREGGKRTPWHC